MPTKHLIILLLLIIYFANYGKSQSNVTPLSGCAPLINVNFTITNPGYSNINWDFGDGASSINSTAYHTYSNPGSYIVVFSGELNGNSITDTTTIVVFQNPTAEFELLSPDTGCNPLTAEFNDLSLTSGGINITQRQWTFGDGFMESTSSSTISHTYLFSGLYDVSLEVTDNNGCQDFILSDSLIWISTNPEAQIISDLNSIVNCDTPITVSFTGVGATASILSTSLSYFWDFDNGIVSDSINNQIPFNTGSYLVSLYIEDEFGCNTTVSENINIASPIADFELWNSNDFTVCDTAVFKDLTGVGTAFWNYGDGSTGYDSTHFYSSTGNYDVTLTVTLGGCIVDTLITVTVEDVGAMFVVDTTYGCNDPFPVQFTDSSSNAVDWYYNFDDGNSSTSQNPLHYYENTNIGLYSMPDSQLFYPSLVAYSQHGCSDSYIFPDTLVLDMSVAWFMPNVTYGDAPLTITFSDSSYSPGNIISWYWDFGDGSDTTTSTDIVDHTFTVAGVYDVYLTITNDFGCDDISYPMTILVNESNGYSGGT